MKLEKQEQNWPTLRFLMKIKHQITYKILAQRPVFSTLTIKSYGLYLGANPAVTTVQAVDPYTYTELITKRPKH